VLPFQKSNLLIIHKSFEIYEESLLGAIISEALPEAMNSRRLILLKLILKISVGNNCFFGVQEFILHTLCFQHWLPFL